MERGRFIRPGARGGGPIPTIRSDVARLVTGGLAVGALIVIGAYAAWPTPVDAALVWMATGLGVALMLIGLAMGRSTPVQLAVVATAAGYVGSLYLRGVTFDGGSPFVAVGLLASSELAHWSIDARVRSLDDVEVHVQRARSIALLLAGAMVLVAILDAAASIGPGGAVLAVPATAALLLGLGSAARIAWRRSEVGTAPVESELEISRPEKR